MNTATFRNIARAAETGLDWANAAKNWQSAIDHYPAKGPMAELDKAKMAARRDAALGMAK